MINVRDWTRAALSGAVVAVAFTVASTRPIATITLDLLGDGRPGVTVERPTDGFGGLGIVARDVGVFEVSVEAVDVAGCIGRTGARRPVKVTRP